MANESDSRDEIVEDILRDLSTVPEEVAVCGLILGSSCAISALIGNFLIVLAFFSERSLRQRQNTFIVSAAIMEMLIVILRDVFVLGVYARRSWQFGTTMMYANNLIFISRNGFAIGHVVAVTVYRYVLIVHPKLYRTMSKTGVLVVTFMLVFLIPVTIGTMVTMRKLIFNTKCMFCVTEQSLGIHNGTLIDDAQVGFNELPSYMYITITASILTSCNVHIYLYIKRSSRRVAGAVQVRTPSLGGNSGDVNRTTALCTRATRKEVRFVKIMAIIFAAFLFSYYTIPVLMTVDKRLRMSHWSYLPAVMLNWFSSSVNWVIFTATHPKFRETVKRLLRLPVRSRASFRS